MTTVRWFVLRADASGFVSARNLVSANTADDYSGGITLSQATAPADDTIRIIKGTITTAQQTGTILDPTNRGTDGHVFLDEYTNINDHRLRGHALRNVGTRRVRYVRPRHQYSSAKGVSAYGSATGLTYGDAWSGIETLITQGAAHGMPGSALSIFFAGINHHEDADISPFNSTRLIGTSASSSDWGGSTSETNVYEYRGDLPYESGQVLGFSLLTTAGYAWRADGGNSWLCDATAIGALANLGTPSTIIASAWTDSAHPVSMQRMTQISTSGAWTSAINTTSNAYFVTAFGGKNALRVIMPDQTSAANHVFGGAGYKYNQYEGFSAQGVLHHIRWKGLIMGYGIFPPDACSSASAEDCHIRFQGDHCWADTRSGMTASAEQTRIWVSGCEISFATGGIYGNAGNSGATQIASQIVRNTSIHDIGELPQHASTDNHAVAIQNAGGRIVVDGCSIARTGGAIHPYWSKNVHADASGHSITDTYISGRAANFQDLDSDASDNAIQFGGDDQQAHFRTAASSRISNVTIRGFRNGIRSKWPGEINVCACDIQDVDYGIKYITASAVSEGRYNTRFRVWDTTIAASVAYTLTTNNTAFNLGINAKNNTIIASAGQVVATGLSGSQTFADWQDQTVDNAATASAMVTAVFDTGSTRQDPA